jgi:hypothetical protein
LSRLGPLRVNPCGGAAGSNRSGIRASSGGAVRASEAGRGNAGVADGDMGCGVVRVPAVFGPSTGDPPAGGDGALAISWRAASSGLGGAGAGSLIRGRATGGRGTGSGGRRFTGGTSGTGPAGADGAGAGRGARAGASAFGAAGDSSGLTKWTRIGLFVTARGSKKNKKARAPRCSSTEALIVLVRIDWSIRPFPQTLN